MWPSSSDERFPTSGEWSTGNEVLLTLQDRQAQRALERVSKQQLWRKWQMRMSFDVWRRQFLRTNHRILGRLMHNMRIMGKSAMRQQAFARWVAFCEMKRRREMSKLQEVAKMRLSLLMSGQTKDTLAPVRQLAVRWQKALLYKIVRAWRELARKADRTLAPLLAKGDEHYMNRLLSRACRRVAAVFRARWEARRAVRTWRRIGIARALRAWVDATDSRLAKRASKSLLAWRRVGLARALRAWTEVTEAAMDRKRAIGGALRSWRRIGLARALRTWEELVDAANALQRMGQIVLQWQRRHLARMLREWIAQTDLSATHMKWLRRAAERWHQINLSRALRTWVTACDRAARQIAGNAARAWQRIGMARAMRTWVEAYGSVGKLLRAAGNAVRAWQRIGLARALRAWEELAAAANALLRMGQIVLQWQRRHLARMLREWIAQTDLSATHQKWLKRAAERWHQIGLARALAQWVAAADRTVEERLKKTMLAWRRIGLARALRAWVEATDHEATHMKWLRRAAERWRGGTLRVAFKAWIASLIAAAALAKLASGQFFNLRRVALQEGFAALCECAGRRSKTGQVAWRSIHAWRNQALHAAFMRMADLTSKENLLNEAIGRTLASLATREIRWGFEQLNANRLEGRVPKSILRRLAEATHLGSERRGFRAMQEASGMTIAAKRRAEAGAVLLRRLKLDDAIAVWKGLIRQIREVEGVLMRGLLRWAAISLPIAFEGWKRTTRQLKVMGFALRSHQSVVLQLFFRKLAQHAAAVSTKKLEARRALAFWTGDRHAIVFFFWRQAAEQRRALKSLVGNAVAQFRRFSFSDCFAAWVEVTATLERGLRIGRQALGRWAHLKVAAAHAQWLSVTLVLSRNLSLLTHATRRIMHQKLAAGLEQWTDSTTSLSRKLTLSAAALNRWKHQELSVAYAQWVDATTSYTRRLEMLKAAARRIASRHLVMGFVQWVAATTTLSRNLELLSQAVRRLSHQKLVMGFVQWVGATTARMAKIALAQSSVRRWTYGALLLSLEQWVLVTLTHARKLQLAKQAAGRWTNQKLSHGWTRWRGLVDDVTATARMAKAAADEAARAAATRAAAIEAEHEAQRLQLEADSAVLLNTLISGCADEIAQRQKLLGAWADSHPVSHTPGATRGASRGTDPSIAGLFQTIDTDGDGQISLSEWSQAFEQAQLQPVGAMPAQVVAAQSHAAALREAYISAVRHSDAASHATSSRRFASPEGATRTVNTAYMPTFPSRNLPEAVEALRATPMAFGACNRTPASAEIWKSSLDATSAVGVDEEIAELRRWVERESLQSSRLSSRPTSSIRGSIRSAIESPQS